MDNIITKNNLGKENFATRASTTVVSVSPQKSLFVENVKKWVLIDSQLKVVNEKTKKMREMKNDITDSICKYMIDNKMSQNKIEINDGELRIYEKNEYSSLTYGYIEKCLAELIHDSKQVDIILQYLKENREISSSHDIRRTWKKV